jgi:radical SAM family uncharacterized protein
MVFSEESDDLWRILARVRKPSRYTGGEWGARIPSEASGELLRFCLAFPDVYEVGMSYVGFQILYALAKALPGVGVERCYCPWTDMERELVASGRPLFSLEGCRPLKEFHVLGFTLQYELTYTNVLTMLHLGGIPLRSAERGEDDPLVVAGGPGALTPEPMSPFIDAFCVGDGEILLPEILECLRAVKGASREERLRQLAAVPGVYVPAFVTYTPGPSGFFVSGGSTPLPVERRFVPDLDKVFAPETMVVPSTEIVHDRAVVEVFRGCTRGCRFCQAGMVHRPLRERAPGSVEHLVEKLLDASGYEEAGLMSLATCDYSHLSAVLDRLGPLLKGRHTSLSLPSLRMDAFSVALADSLEPLRRGGLTFAPEAGTARLRAVINKGISEEDMENTVDETFRRGWERVKLYFMMGLPTETMEDLEGILSVSKRLLAIGRRHTKRAQMVISVAGVVPKAHTPFQWDSPASMEELREKGRFLKSRTTDKRITLSYHEPEQTFLEGVLGRGDSRLGDVVERAWQLGARFDGWGESFDFGIWRRAFEETGVDPFPVVLRERGQNEPFPWDHIRSGVRREFLWKERERSRKALLTPDCRGACTGCGFERHCLRSRGVAGEPLDGDCVKGSSCDCPLPVSSGPSSEIPQEKGSA